MMRDKVVLLIGQQRIEHFLSYTIDADIYTADDAFQIEVANPETTITPGQRCEILVNGERELTGIIDRIEKRYDIHGVSLSLSGRDLCGLLVDHYIESYATIRNTTMKAIAESLIANVPYIQREQITYQENVRVSAKRRGSKEGKTAWLEAHDTAHPHDKAQIEPGMTVFEALRTYAQSRGMMFFSLPDGSFVFGRPKAGGEPVYRFITRKSDPTNNNVLFGSLIDDISRRWSKVVIHGQQQGRESGATVLDTDGDYASGTTAASVNTKGTVTDPAFPFYKPYVQQDNNDGISPSLHAREIMERMKFEGFQLSYRCPGHSQGGTNFKINEMATVDDDVLDVRGSYLVYGRTFLMSRYGVFTELKLGYPGVMLE